MLAPVGRALAEQQGAQRAAVDDVRHGFTAVDVKEGRGQVDCLDQCIAARAAGGVGATVGVVDDQRGADDGLVEQVFSPIQWSPR